MNVTCPGFQVARPPPRIMPAAGHHREGESERVREGESERGRRRDAATQGRTERWREARDERERADGRGYILFK